MHGETHFWRRPFLREGIRGKGLLLHRPRRLDFFGLEDVVREGEAVGTLIGLRLCVGSDKTYLRT